MSEKQELLTAKEFASLMNMSASTLNKKLRAGEIKGEKISGRWMIPKTELNSMGRPAAAPAAEESSRTAGESYSVETFAEKTYLTTRGVIAFLKSGQLKGKMDAEGNWQVDAESLLLPHIRHLVR